MALFDLIAAITKEGGQWKSTPPVDPMDAPRPHYMKRAEAQLAALRAARYARETAERIRSGLYDFRATKGGNGYANYQDNPMDAPSPKPERKRPAGKPKRAPRRGR